MTYIIIIALIVLGEFILRKHVRERLLLNHKVEKKGWPIDFHHIQNEGMIESKLKDKPQMVKTIALVAMICIVVTFFCLLPLKGKKALKAGLALIIGGGLANLLERFFQGYVTDYIVLKVPFPRIRGMVYNVADFCIFIGALLTILGGCMKD